MIKRSYIAIHSSKLSYVHLNVSHSHPIGSHANNWKNWAWCVNPSMLLEVTETGLVCELLLLFFFLLLFQRIIHFFGMDIPVSQKVSDM